MNIQKKKSFCANCGKMGHIYKKCTFAITSLGIILFRVKKKNKRKIIPENDIEFLIIRRRDTLGYVEFLRGRYSLSDMNFIKSMFEEMTINEKRKLKEKDFDTLWNELWMIQENDDIIQKQYRNEYYGSKEKILKLKEGFEIENGEIITLDMLINNAEKVWVEPEWGFPKGRRNANETDIICAHREFKEETGVSQEHYKILGNNDTLTEIFLGSNNIIYKHIYYYGICLTDIEPVINSNSMVQLTEVGGIKWCKYKEVLEKFRFYDIEKRNVLKHLFQKINFYKLYRKYE